MLYFDGHIWKDCCSNFQLTGPQFPIIMRGHLTRFVNLANIGMVSIPPNVCLLGIPDELRKDLLLTNLFIEISEAECQSGYLWKI